MTNRKDQPRAKVACREYAPDELLNALRDLGLGLVERFFRPHPDTDALITGSVGPNTYRGFPKQQPSAVYVPWARSRMTFSAVAELGEITSQRQMDELVEKRFADLSDYWKAQTRVPLVYGPGRKLVNLLHKAIVRDIGVSDAGRKRVIPFLHVPHDKHCLAAVRLSVASGQFGPSDTIPQGASMGYIKSKPQYDTFQQLLRRIAQAADVPPICIDLLAWDHAHGMRG